MPRVAHHQLKVVVVVDRGGYVGVVLLEFLRGDATVVRSRIERVHKFKVNIALGLAAGEDVRVLRSIVHPHNVIDINNTAAVPVKLGEGHTDKTTAARVHLSTHTA